MDRVASSLVSVDPGATIGLCRVSFADRAFLTVVFPDTLTKRVLDSCLPIGHLIIERWFLYPSARVRKFDDMPGPEAIGMVRYWAEERGMPMERIPARLRVPFVGLVPKDIGNAHARDALALALYWVSREIGPAVARQVANWPHETRTLKKEQRG